MPNCLSIEALTESSFAAFGDVIEVKSSPTAVINQGNCQRYSDLAKLDTKEGELGISVFVAKPYPSPLTISLMERHPLGSQSFLPFSNDPFLVIVASDRNGKPTKPIVFITDGKQGVNYHRNVWHAVLTPIAGDGLFAVVDRIGQGDNLEEFVFDEPYVVEF